MPFPLEKPHPALRSSGSSYPPRSHTRSLSRASPSRARITDDLLSDLSPATTLAAFTSSASLSSDKLRASIEAASPGDREFGIRAATAANKIKEWVNELKDWPWPESGSAGFEAPISKYRKHSSSGKGGALIQDSTLSHQLGPEDDISTDNDADKDLYCGSLSLKDVMKYSTRIDEILDDMDDLDVGGIKSHILDLHIPGRSRPTSSASAAPLPTSSLSFYSKMDDFTAVVTATVLHALPYLARLQILMDVWGIRLVLLRQIKPVLNALDDAEAAVRSGWQTLNFSDQSKTAGTKGNGHVPEKRQYLSRHSFDTIQQVLQSKVALVGQKLDRMLDSLEGRLDTLPDAWLDRMDLLERRYADWVALAKRDVLEGEWEKQNSSVRETYRPTEIDDLDAPEMPCSIADNERAQSSPIPIPNDMIRAKERESPNERVNLVEGNSITGDVSDIPRDHPTSISPLDGGKEILEEDRTEPIIPQRPTITIPISCNIETGTKLPSTPPSSKLGSTSKLSPTTDHQCSVDSSYTNDLHRIASVGCEPGKEPNFVIRMAGKTEPIEDKSSTELQNLAKPEDRTENEARQSPATPRHLSSVQLGRAAPEKSASPTTPRQSIVNRGDTIDTGKFGKSFLEPLETPTDFSPMSSVRSTGSSYAPLDSSPSANRVPPAQYTRRVLSPIQSSTDWFDFEDVKTPTKGVLREDPNVLNLPSPKHDGQKPPTPKENLGTLRKMTVGREDLYDEVPSIGEYLAGSERGAKRNDEALTPDPKAHPILSFDEASPEDASPSFPLISKRKSPQLLDSPDFSSSFNIPETPLEPPMLPNVGVLEAPSLFSPVKGSTDQLQQQISEILDSLPTRIRLSTEQDKNPFPDLNVPKKRPVLKKTVSASSLRLPSRSPTPTPSFTLVPAYSKNSPRPRHQNANPEIKLYHLSRSNGGAPIKLFVRLVGENGERVMVRVGGGWADLGEYLREYAIHHSRRNAPEDKIHIHDSSSRIVSSSSISSARNGHSSPVGRSISSMDGPIPRSTTSMDRRTSTNERPVSSLAVRKNKNPPKSVGEDTRQAQYRSPTTPVPVVNQKAVSKRDTPPSATSIGSRSSSRLSFNGEDSYLGLSGPRSRPIELSEESEKWVESMTEKVKQASAEKEKKQMLLGELGKVGSTKRLFRKN